jgi:hypothetical protein
MHISKHVRFLKKRKPKKLVTKSSIYCYSSSLHHQTHFLPVGLFNCSSDNTERSSPTEEAERVITPSCISETLSTNCANFIKQNEGKKEN